MQSANGIKNLKMALEMAGTKTALWFLSLYVCPHVSHGHSLPIQRSCCQFIGHGIKLTKFCITLDNKRSVGGVMNWCVSTYHCQFRVGWSI